MIVRETTVINPSGLHARPAANFVSAAGKYASAIRIRNLTADSRPVNAKSMLMLLSLSLVTGTRIELSADGADEREAAEALIALIDSGCGEAASQG